MVILTKKLGWSGRSDTSPRTGDPPCGLWNDTEILQNIAFKIDITTLVNVYVALPVFMRTASTS